MNNDNGFDTWYNAYIKRMAVTKGYDAYKSALERGHSEDYAMKLFDERHREYLERNLE